MFMKKFELTSETIINNGKTLYRIKALIDFSNIKAGELGGFVEKESNLYHKGNAWVYGNAKVSGDAKVSGNACVSGNTCISGNARVYGNAEVYGNACVSGNARVYGNACVYGNAKVSVNAEVYGNSRVCGNACVSGNALVSGNAKVSGNADYTTISGFGTRFRTTTFFKCSDKKIRVNCGCFYGTIDEFREQVNKTRTGKIAKEYLLIADLMEEHFKED